MSDTAQHRAVSDLQRAELIAELNEAEEAARRALVTLVELVGQADDGWNDVHAVEAMEGLTKVIGTLEASTQSLAWLASFGEVSA